MPRQEKRAPTTLEPLTPFQWGGLLLALICLVFPWFFTLSDDLSVMGHRMLGIFLMAIVLWVTEAIPLHATATVIIALQVLLVSDQALPFLPDMGDVRPMSYAGIFAALANPVLILFLGGFFLADGASKFSLDRNLARVLLRPFGASPAYIMLGLMLVTAMFSMFMSNTATTATMMAVALPVLAQLPPGDRYKIGLALCIPIAANIGGIGTPIGTPPNAIALAALAKSGMPISFLQWMIMAVPFMLIILCFSWLMLLRLFPSKQSSIEIKIEGKFNLTPPAIVFYVVFGTTVLLWLTENIHGVNSSVVGFMPVVVLLSTRVFTHNDLMSIQWHVLWLVAGGIALGNGVGQSGLDAWLVSHIGWEALPAVALVAVLALLALVMSTFISNSATANLLVPIGMSMAATDAVAINPVLAAVFIAIGASLAMALPISTPPNAIAFSTGAVTTRDMVISGAIIGAFGWMLFVLVAPTVWYWLGVLPS